MASIVHSARWLSCALVLGTFACGTSPDEAPSSGKADGFSASDLVDGTPAAVGILALVNDEDTTLETLDDNAGLDKRAAKNIIAERPFDSIVQLDDVSRVGPTAFEKLFFFASQSGMVPVGNDVLGTFDGVTLTVNQAERVLDVVNFSPISVLDVPVGLDSRSVDDIEDFRPFASCLQLADVSFVGPSAFEKLVEYGGEELGIVSDLDKTIIPPHGDELPDDPYAGIARLLDVLENRRAGRPGDMAYVTARSPDRITEIPGWLAARGFPDGPIETGTSPIPHIAQAEKVKDLTKVLEGNPHRRFVLFGDTNHRDPDAYRDIIEAFEGRIALAFIHDVKTIDESRLEGLIVFEHYGQVAGRLFEAGFIDEEEARAVMGDVVASGDEDFDLDDIEALIAAHRPGN